MHSGSRYIWTCFNIMQRKFRYLLQLLYFLGGKALHQLVGVFACLMSCRVVDVDTQICSLQRQYLILYL